jgi:hypothetical protein
MNEWPDKHTKSYKQSPTNKERVTDQLNIQSPTNKERVTD